MTGPDLSSDDRDAFDEVVATAASACGAPDVVAAVVAGGEIVHLHRAGPGPGAGRPEDRVFRIASMTKSFTAAAVLLLRDDGLLKLDDRVADHVPQLAGLRSPSSDAPAITVRHLLTMGAGMASDDPWADRHLDAPPDEMDGLFRAGATFAHPTGTTMEYSNFGYAMLGRVIEAAAGMPCRKVITECFLGPLGLDHTVWEPSRLPDGAVVAPPFRRVDGVAVPDEPEPLGDGGFAPMGGLWSSVRDLARWVDFLASGFPARDGAEEGPLWRASRRELQQVHTVYGTPVLWHGNDGRLRQIGLGYGMGVQRARHLDHGDVVTHSGGLPGYGSNMRWLPQRGVGVVALANITYAPMNVLTHQLLELLGDRGALPPAPVLTAPLAEQAVHDLVALLNDWDDALANVLFADNVLLDEPAGRRAAAAGTAVGRRGRLRVDSLTPTSQAAATAHLTAGDGRELVLRVSLAPTVPPRIQWYEISERPAAAAPG